MTPRDAEPKSPLVFDAAVFEKLYEGELRYLQEARDLLGQVITQVISDT